MHLSRSTRWILIAVCALTALIFGPLALIVAGNAGGAVLDLVLNRRPASQEFVGRYELKVKWGSSTLDIKPDGSFCEQIRESGKVSRMITGRWSSGDDGPNFTPVNFQPFGMVWDDDHDRDIGSYRIEFRKPHFGKTYGLIDDDLGEAFKRQ